MRKKTLMPIIGSVAMAVLAAGCADSSPQAARPPTVTRPSTNRPSTAAASSTGTTAVEVATSLTVVSCPTTFALAPPPSTVPLPASATVDVPQAVATKVAIYRDTSDILMLLAPKGWSCSASYGADGSGGVTVVPPGETLPAAGLKPHSSDQAITGSETGGSPVQAAAQACSFFPAAAAATETDLEKGCSPRPASETVDPISTSVVDFEDPSGLKGTGDPSGGRNPANGVMTYSADGEPGFYIETCTLPKDAHDTCTAALNYFIARFGQG